MSYQDPHQFNNNDLFNILVIVLVVVAIIAAITAYSLWP